jgi:hypothetical protein
MTQDRFFAPKYFLFREFLRLIKTSFYTPLYFKIIPESKTSNMIEGQSSVEPARLRALKLLRKNGYDLKLPKMM